MASLPKEINVGDPYDPLLAEYLLRPVGQKEIPQTRQSSSGITKEAIFQVWVITHDSYPRRLIPAVYPVERPESGQQEDMMLVAASFRPDGELERARVVTIRHLPRGVRSRIIHGN